MEYNNEKLLKKRHYSNSPFNQNYIFNNNKKIYYQESYSTQNLDSSISQDEFNYNEANQDFQKILYENNIIKRMKNKKYDLMEKANDDNNTNEALENQINSLNIQNVQYDNMPLYKNNYFDLDKDFNNYYRNIDNNYKDGRNSSTKIKNRNNIINNIYDFEEKEQQNYIELKRKNNEIINLKNKINELENELSQKKKNIIKLSNINRELENKNLIFENKYLMSISNNNININNYKIRNNGKNNLNYNNINIIDHKALTQNQFFKPKKKNDTFLNNFFEDHLPYNEFHNLNKNNNIQTKTNSSLSKKNSQNEKEINNINNIKTIKIEYEKLLNEFNKIKNENQKYISERKKYVNQKIEIYKTHYLIKKKKLKN